MAHSSHHPTLVLFTPVFSRRLSDRAALPRVLPAGGFPGIWAQEQLPQNKLPKVMRPAIPNCMRFFPALIAGCALAAS